MDDRLCWRGGIMPRELRDEQAAKSPEKPFFLFHSTQAAHLPSLPGKDFQGKTKAGPHGDFIAELDHVVGTLVKKIDDLGMKQDTLIILTSDNGPEVTSVVNMRKDYQHDGARPWRGVKRDQWEGGHRVPFIARWPGQIPAATISAQTVCLTDLMATCASITGATLPRNAAEDSFDMKSVLLGKSDGKPVRDFTLHQTWTFDLAIRRGDWKFLNHKGSGGNKYTANSELGKYILPEAEPDAPGQLYNLADDPGETKNLYNEHPEIVEQEVGGVSFKHCRSEHRKEVGRAKLRFSKKTITKPIRTYSRLKCLLPI